MTPRGKAYPASPVGVGAKPEASNVALASDAATAPAAGGLGARLEALEEELDRLHSSLHRMFADLEIRAIDGYFVKVWPCTETGEWVAECPTVGVAVQEKSRDEALRAVAVMIEEMLQAKQEFGDPIPPKDV